MKKIIFVSLVFSLIVFSCKKEKAEEPEPSTPVPASVSFAADVQPIFHVSCGTGTHCHSTSNAADSKVYETHAGAAAVPASTTLGAIKHESGFEKMPKSTPQLSLTSAEIATIESWIDGGKKND